jgi:hypothetical protein
MVLSLLEVLRDIQINKIEQSKPIKIGSKVIEISLDETISFLEEY